MWKRQPKRSNQYIPLTPQDYPAGVAVQTIKGAYLINKDGKKYRIPSKKVLDSWNFPIVVITTELALEKYPTAVRKLPYRDGSLLNNIADGKLYLVSAATLRHITSPELFTRLGVSKDDAIVVSDAEIKSMDMGAEIY
jgi:hypothetical protein